MHRLRVAHEFDVAHKLIRGDFGKCLSLHGHRPRVELFVIGDDLSEDGVLVDFTKIKKPFREFIDDAGVVSDAVTFEAEPSKFVISAGDTGSKMRIDLDSKNELMTNLKVKERSRSIYSVSYLKKMAKAASVSDVANLSFAT